MAGGGIVTQTTDLGESIEVVVIDNYNDKTATQLERNDMSRSISEGDVVWWQDTPIAHWTASIYRGTEWSKETHDLKIPRIGFSYRPRIEQSKDKQEN